MRQPRQVWEERRAAGARASRPGRSRAASPSHVHPRDRRYSAARGGRHRARRPRSRSLRLDREPAISSRCWRNASCYWTLSWSGCPNVSAACTSAALVAAPPRCRTLWITTSSLSGQSRANRQRLGRAEVTVSLGFRNTSPEPPGQILREHPEGLPATERWIPPAPSS